MKTGVLRVYKSYMFRQKDPIIDKLRTAVQNSGKSYVAIEKDSGVGVHTMWNWFQGDTNKPQFCTIAAVASALDLDVALVPKSPSIGHNSGAVPRGRSRRYRKN